MTPEPEESNAAVESNRDDARSTPSRKRLLFRIAKWTVAVLVVIGLLFAGRQAIDQWQEESQRLTDRVADIDRQLQQQKSSSERQTLQLEKERLVSGLPHLANLHWNWIAVAALLYGAGLVPPAFLLRSALQSMGQSPTVGTAIAAQLIGHAGKYVPGKAMVIVLRAGVLNRDGVGTLAATVGVFLETFLMMAVGATLASLIIFWLPVPRWFAFASLLVGLVACAPTIPPVLRRVAKRVAEDGSAYDASRIGWKLFASGWGWSILSWALFGASFAFLIAAIPSLNPLPDAMHLYAIATAAICLAVVAGFASLIPGGAGVRELVLTTILGVSIGPVHGILAALAARVLYLVVEAVAAGLAWLWLHRNRSHAGTD